MDRFSVNINLSDHELGKVLLLIKSARRTPAWSYELYNVVIKIQNAVEALHLDIKEF